MRYQNIEQYITQFPIYQYEIIDSNEIEFNDKVRTICKQECSRYGSSWSCPPAVGKLDKCKEKCLGFSKALIFSSVAEVANYTDMNEMLKSKREHEQITKQIAKFLKANGVPHYVLSTDSCSLCDKCSYPKKSCLRPESMIPCIESHGIVVVNILEAHQMDYFLGENMMLWFSIIFLEEE